MSSVDEESPPGVEVELGDEPEPVEVPVDEVFVRSRVPIV